MDEGQYECWCGHVLDWHAERAFNYACTVDGCACKTFQGDRRAAERPTPASEPQPKTEEVSNVDEARSQSQLASVSATPSTLAPPDTDARIAADVRKDIQPTCHFARPGRGDCAHYVGLPAVLDETTTDVYGKPNGWCWWCWRAHQLEQSRAECSRLRATLNGTASALDASEQERRILIDHAATLSATLDAREAELARFKAPNWPTGHTSISPRAASSLSEEPNP